MKKLKYEMLCQTFLFTQQSRIYSIQSFIHHPGRENLCQQSFQCVDSLAVNQGCFSLPQSGRCGSRRPLCTSGIQRTFRTFMAADLLSNLPLCSTFSRGWLQASLRHASLALSLKCKAGERRRRVTARGRRWRGQARQRLSAVGLPSPRCVMRSPEGRRQHT